MILKCDKAVSVGRDNAGTVAMSVAKCWLNRTNGALTNSARGDVPLRRRHPQAGRRFAVVNTRINDRPMITVNQIGRVKDFGLRPKLGRLQESIAAIFAKERYS
ncbi:MAG: hypothetical protein N2C12_16730 [Planctomycetales bacterium]